MILHELDRLAPPVMNSGRREVWPATAEAIEVSLLPMTVTLTTAVHTIYGGTLGTIKQKFRAADPLAEGLTESDSPPSSAPSFLTPASHNPGDAIPTAYSRNASTHGAGMIQNRQLNSLTSLMLVVSLLVV